MANHKLTLTGHLASKKIQDYLRGAELHGSDRRLAFADGVIAISGNHGSTLKHQVSKLSLDIGSLLVRFEAMIAGYGFKLAEDRPAHVCAEAQLWMTLVARHVRPTGDGQSPRHLHLHPRHLDVWVYEIDRKNRPKEDSPCLNCRQWVRKEFRTVNGTA
jgi:hypothetical protein